MRPLVSIVVCTRNRSDMLRETMKTIRSQRYRPVEIVVVDDGSTDDTKEVLAEFGNDINYFHQDRKGIAEARSVGCRRARGEFIAFQDDDDLMPPDRIDDLLDGMRQHPEAVLAVGDWELIDPDGRDTGKRSRFGVTSLKGEPVVIEDGYRAVLWPLVTPLPHTTLFRRSDAQRVGWFDAERFFHACSDTDFFARLGRLGPVVYVPKIVSYYRMGHAQIWGRKLLGEYSRFLLFEKHLMSLEETDRELKARLRQRLLAVLRQISAIGYFGGDDANGVPADYVKRGLGLLDVSGRLSYLWYRAVQFPVSRLLRSRPADTAVPDRRAT